MKVSIITATYNSAATIRDNLLSIQHQNHKAIEHVVVDGNSSDNTLNILGNLGHNGPVICETDSGIYDAMNKGLRMATGDIIGILNSDDFYPHSGVLKRVVHAFKTSKCDAVYGDLLYVHPAQTEKVLRKWRAGSYKNNSFYQGWMPPHPTFFVKRSVYEKFGMFNLKFKSSSDYELLLRFMLLHKIKVHYIPDILVHMRAGGHSNCSIKNRVAAHREDHLAWKSNGILPKWYTLPLKPLRKLSQFVIASHFDFPTLLTTEKFINSARSTS